MRQGYVKLWRKSLDSSLWSNPSAWRLWEWCLMKASWKPTKVMVGYQEVDLGPGQFIFGRHKASVETKLSEQTVRTALLALLNCKNLTIKSTNKYSIITIINWDIYQQDEEPINHQSNQELTSNQPATNHIQEGKEVKKKRKPLTPFVEIPDWIGLEVWEGFREHRKSKNSKMTENAEILLIKKLSRFRDNGQDPIEIINQSIMQGWSGLFELKDNGNKTPTLNANPISRFDDWEPIMEEQPHARVIPET
jgi:hypothetical protein